MERYGVKFAIIWISIAVLFLGGTTHSAWWNDDHTECPCFTSSLIDAHFVSVVEELPQEAVVEGGLNDISGEVYIGQLPNVLIFRANTNYTFGPENEGTCTLIARGLSELLPKNQYGEFELPITQNQHNSCLQEIKRSSAFLFREAILTP